MIVKLTIRKERGEQMRDWLLNARKERELTQLDVAKRLDISEAYFNYIENGERQKKMDIALASKLSVILDIPLAEIIEFEKSEGRM